MTVRAPSERRTFLDSTADHYGPVVRLGAMIGMRCGELCGLRWIDVDLDGSALSLRKTVTTVAPPRRVGRDDGAVPPAYAPRPPGAAGLPRVRLHDLGHNHATYLLAAGVNIKVVSERLGHASTASTLDTYAHVMPGQQASAAAPAARLVDGGT